ncbi:hypothetical protein BDN72DRAFT_770445, partial [Pluteus cervinus]
SLVDVSFDFFDPNPKIDYHAIKRLLTQLFHHDAELFHIHELTELILGQPTVGTTIKTDGIESDPYALLTVLNMHVWKDHPSIRAIGEYVLQKAQTSEEKELSEHLKQLFSQTEHHVGLVICERLINMPVQVVPPMYKMLRDEIGWANDDGEPYTFSHLLFISKAYHLTEEEESAFMSNAPVKPSAAKKAKKAAASVPAGSRPADGLYLFHPEDDCIKQFATHTVNYAYTKGPSTPRDSESFGLDTRGRMTLVPRENLDALISKMEETYNPA